MSVQPNNIIPIQKINFHDAGLITNPDIDSNQILRINEMQEVQFEDFIHKEAPLVLNCSGSGTPPSVLINRRESFEYQAQEVYFFQDFLEDDTSILAASLTFFFCLKQRNDNKPTGFGQKLDTLRKLKMIKTTDLNIQ